MKSFYKIIAAIFVAAFLFSCKQQTAFKKQEKLISTVSPGKRELNVKLIGEVRTRRTFADIQFMDDEKERERYIAKQAKSNPTLDQAFTAADSMLARQFKRLGLIENDEFLLHKFKRQTNEKINFVDSDQQKFPIRFFYDSISGNIHFKILLSTGIVDIDTKATPLQDLDYAFLDVIPGGNKELVFLDHYYIMNGYNFDFRVYEIKTH